jgi:four helix bundle protein
VQVFDHEKMDVFRVSIEFISLIESIISTFPKGKAYLADQLRRAGTSIALNIAEGAGEFSPDEKARFYRIAKRSATECAAILAVCQTLKLSPSETDIGGRHLLFRIVSMLTKMVKSIGMNEAGTGTGTHAGTNRVLGTKSEASCTTA